MWLGGVVLAPPLAQESGRTQRPITHPEFRTASLSMLDNFKPMGAHDSSGINGGKNFERGMCFFGFLEDMRHAALMPQAASMVRILFAGCMEFFLIAATDLLRAGLCSDLKSATGDSVKAAFVSLTLDKVKAATEAGARLFYAKLEPSQAIYIPQGFFCVEIVSQGPLVFGIRKSYFELTPRPDSIGRLHDAGVLIGFDGVMSDKHTAVLDCLRQADGEEQELSCKGAGSASSSAHAPRAALR